MRRIAACGAICVFLGGCATDVWDKPGATQAEFNVDQGQCEMYARGEPQVAAPYVPPTYTATTTSSGTYMGTGNMGTYTGVSQTTIQPDNTGQAFANLGAAIGNLMRQKDAMRTCMASKGYTLR